jgi:hypothetical protein
MHANPPQSNPIVFTPEVEQRQSLCPSGQVNAALASCRPQTLKVASRAEL